MSEIDISSASTFGTLTAGSGTAAVFDDNPLTTAYYQHTTGYAGVTLSTPKRIEKVEVVSSTNGFDGSGSNTAISLNLYGKVGDAPTSATDGVVLGTSSFTDENIQKTVSLYSSDKITKYNHVWVRVATGVWSVIADIRMYEAPEPEPVPAPTPLAAGSHVFARSCDVLVPLISSGTEISQFRTKIYLAEPRNLLLDFHADVIHTGAGSDGSVAVGFSFWICKRSSETEDGLKSVQFSNIRSAVGGGNVSEINPQHYGNKSICTALQVPAGFHEFSIIGNGHTDGSSTQGILKVLAEGGMGLNCLRVTVLP